MRKLNGSFTVEASVVVPMVMVILLSVIFVTLWIHDGIAMKSISSYSALESANPSLSLEDGSYEGFLSRSLILGRKITASAQGSERSGKASASAHFSVPIPLARELLGERITFWHASVTCSNMNGRKILLPYKAFLDGADRVLAFGTRE